MIPEEFDHDTLAATLAYQAKRIARLEKLLRSENERIKELLQMTINQAKIIMDQRLILSKLVKEYE